MTTYEKIVAFQTECEKRLIDFDFELDIDNAPSFDIILDDALPDEDVTQEEADEMLEYYNDTLNDEWVIYTEENEEYRAYAQDCDWLESHPLANRFYV